MFGRKKAEQKKAFIDLNGYSEYSSLDAKVKAAEITAYRDLKPHANTAYRGNILVMVFSRSVEGDDVKREISKRHLVIAADTNGVFTKASDRLTILSSSGPSIDKCRNIQGEMRCPIVRR